MAEYIIMPKQGQSVESCIITKWNKRVGENVNAGDVLFSYETDKATFEQESAAAGKLLAILAAEGDDVPCLDHVAIIGQEGEDISAMIDGPKPKEVKKADEEKAEAPAADPGGQIVTTTVQSKEDGPRVCIAARKKSG